MGAWEAARDAVLKRVTISDVLEGRGGSAAVVSVDPLSPFSDALGRLRGARISSAPVLRPGVPGVVGFVDLRDCADAVLQLAVPPEALAKAAQASSPHQLSLCLKAPIAVAAFGAPLDELQVVLPSEDGQALGPDAGKSTLLAVATNVFLAGGGGGAVHHRCVVYGEDDATPAGVVTMSDVVKALQQSLGRLASSVREANPALDRLASTPICKLGLGTEAPVTVSHDVVALDAFGWMRAKNLSCLAVHDEAGRAVEVVTLTDILAADPAKLVEELAEPIFSFVSRRRGTHLGGAPLSPLVFCTPHTHLDQALDLLVENGVHHLLLLDENAKAVGIVTPTDILRSACAED